MEYIETYLRQDFPNNQYNTTALQNEIRGVTALELKYMYINTFGNEVYIYFDEELTIGEKNSLDYIVANHDMDFGKEPDDVEFDLPSIVMNEDITFNTPRPTALPSSNSTYSNFSVLGTGGPDLSHVTNMSFTWDLGNTQLNSFNVSTDNGQPSWWVNLIPATTHTFGLENPELTLQGTNIPNFDGNYWINYYEDGLALVSKTGGFSIYASNDDEGISYVPKEFTERFVLTNPEGKFYASENYFNTHGNAYKFIKLYEEQSTSSSAYQTVLSLTTNDLLKGNYRISVSHRYGMSVTNNEFYSRLLLNAQQLGNEFISRESRNTNRKFNQFVYVETLEGINTIDLQYRRGAGTAYISDMIIEIWRVN
jgi:hypothetical protein